jgi:uncharacterized membrane protein YwaF
VNRQTLLWTLVVFFGASIAFGAINNATDGESTAVRLGFQLLALAVIVAAIALFVRRRG